MNPEPTNQTPDPGVKAEMPRYFSLLYEALSEMQMAKPNDRSERDRMMAIAKTDLEKVIAYVAHYLV